MSTRMHISIFAILAAAILTAPAEAQDVAAASKAQQRRLLKALDSSLKSQTLTATLNKNQERWAAMTPEQRQQYRDRYNAWLKLDPKRQLDLIQAEQSFSKLSPKQQEMYRQRAEWLTKVVASLSAAEREALKRLPAPERAKRLLELKAELVDKKPATQPSE